MTSESNLFLTKFVSSIVINKPYDSIRLILPEIISPMWRVLKSFNSDLGALLALNFFKVTSTRFDKGSTDRTLHSSFLLNCCIYSNLYKSFWPTSEKINKWLTCQLEVFQQGNLFQGSRHTRQINLRGEFWHQSSGKVKWNILLT